MWRGNGQRIRDRPLEALRRAETMKYVLQLEDCSGETEKVGGKAGGLGSLLEYGLPVPPGFAVTTDAYRACVEAAGLADRIVELLEEGKSAESSEAASERIQALFSDDVLTDEVAAEITEAYERLGGSEEIPVAVRSSATAEDTADASFAGQQESYLWIRGSDAVRRHVVRCWASLFTERAIDYRARLGIPPEDLAMGVVVQEMVPAEAAGVMMTIDPVHGDRSKLYVESAFGLGEIVVRGEVEADRITIDKETLSPVSEEISEKERAYRFDEEHGEVRLVEVPASQRGERSLSEREVTALAKLGNQVEEAFGMPMDVEWAVAAGSDDPREVFLVQARPETVWSKMEAPPASSNGAGPDAVRGRHDPWDNLQSWTDPRLHWTTSIIGEDVPGVATPLCWSLWGPGSEYGARESLYASGALTRAERRVPDAVEDRWIRIFYGRLAAQVEFMALLGDRMPGTSGEEAVTSIFGRVPETMKFRPTKRRYPLIAAHLPFTFLTIPARVRAVSREYKAWWQESVTRLPTLSHEETIEVFKEGAERFNRGTALQGTALFCVVQPLFDALGRLVESTGVGDLSTLTAASGGAEMEVVADVWRASRGEIELADVIRSHGFHGPGEGELSSRVWREDETPVRSMIDQFKQLDDSQSPQAREAERHRQVEEIERQALAAMPRGKRPSARLLFHVARKRLPLRGIPKDSFLQAFDVCRAAARQIGAHFAEAGRLDDPDDAFFLTADELTGELPADAEELVAKRRERRAIYEGLELPVQWVGMPEPISADDVGPDIDAEGVISGIGVSTGVVEGTARVALTPKTKVEPGEVLVAPTTDPSWTSIMFISSALVVDIGGALSHAAVVARELGIPCVVNTRTGTKALQDGDRVRVDGSKGTVQILDRQEDATEEVLEDAK